MIESDCRKNLSFQIDHWEWRKRRWKRAFRETVQGLRHPGTGGPIVVKALIVLTLIFFGIMVLQGMVAGLNPILSPPSGLLIHSGGQFMPALMAGEWWRCVTYAFTHAGIIHLGFNMLVLWQIGPLIENEVGAARFIFLYFLATLTGTFASLFWNMPPSPTGPFPVLVGASGAIFGLIGFAAAYYHRIGGPEGVHRRNFMLQWAAFAFLFGLIVPRIDNAAHLGGAIGGVVLGLLLPVRGQLLRRTDPFFNVLGGASAFLILASLFLLVLSWF